MILEEERENSHNSRWSEYWQKRRIRKDRESKERTNRNTRKSQKYQKNSFKHHKIGSAVEAGIEWDMGGGKKTLKKAIEEELREF